MSDNARMAIRDEIQRGYGDATQIVLDDRVAGAVVARLRSEGWLSPEEVRLLVAAAGGEVRVPIDLASDPPRTLWRHEDPRTGDVVLAVKR